ncbi:MAG: triose-phosphate isomerase [Minisyncoccota bacterium]
MQSKKYIIGNWKANPATLSDAEKLFVSTARAAKVARGATVVVCPPAVFLPALARLRERGVVLGAQDVSVEKEGAFTGEISASMLASSGAKMVIIGHSERRARGERDEDVAKKIRRALAVGLVPILCVGESVRGNEGEHISFVHRQLLAALRGIPRAKVGSLVVAYEPIWAIGKNATRAATAVEAHEMAIVIRRTIAELFGRRSADVTTILYGGSVDEKNAAAFLDPTAGMNGLLVGRASLSTKTFTKIISLAAQVPSVLTRASRVRKQKK